MLYLHCLATIDTLQDFRMRINKFQLYPSLSKKLNVFFFFFLMPVWILLKYQPYHQLGHVITTSTCLFSGIMFEKNRDSAIGQQQKAYSMLIVSVKSSSQHGGFVKVQIKKPFGDSIRPATILFQDSITS